MMALLDSGCQRHPKPDVLADMAQAVSSAAGNGNRPHEHCESESTNAWRGVKRPADQRAADAQRWIEARLAGTSINQIARSAGVSRTTVSRATSTAVQARQAGRFPSAAEVEGWVLHRREGVSVADLAHQSGWSVRTIGQHTRAFGPYPRPQTNAVGEGQVDARTVRRWVQDRQSRISLVTIAQNSETTIDKVARATKPFGPFPTPQRAPAGHLTFRQVSARLGISRPALQRRLEQNELPAPAGHNASGWPYWRAGDIEHWITTLPLRRCDICGAYLKRLDWHMISRHGRPRQQRQRRRGS